MDKYQACKDGRQHHHNSLVAAAAAARTAASQQQNQRSSAATSARQAANAAAAAAAANPGGSATAVPTPSTGGAIKVISSPEGVQVAIDGSAVGTAPATFRDIAPGPHTLQFSKGSYEPVSREVTVKTGQTIQVSAFLAAAVPTPTPAPGFTGILAGIALVVGAIVVRMRK